MSRKHELCGRPVALLAARVEVDDRPLYAFWCAECGQLVEHEHSAIVIGADEVDAEVVNAAVR
jgi:hypothetical protein